MKKKLWKKSYVKKSYVKGKEKLERKNYKEKLFLSLEGFGFFIVYLDASSNLYNRVCPSVRRSVSPSVGPSVGQSVGPSVRPSVTCYFRVLEIAKSLNENHWADQL